MSQVLAERKKKPMQPVDSMSDQALVDHVRAEMALLERMCFPCCNDLLHCPEEVQQAQQVFDLQTGQFPDYQV
jgi:hypothetical protein